MRRILIALVVATWQIEMAVQCAIQCVHRKTPEVPVFKAAIKQPIATPSPQPCRGPQCQMPQPPRPSAK